MALLAPFLAPFDPNTKVADPELPPGGPFVMGTDRGGQDVLSRIIWGSRVPLAIIAVATTISLALGLPLGLLSGFAGGRLDRAILLVMDSIYAFPGLLLAIAIAAVIGRGILNVSFAIAVVYIPTYFRVIRNHVASVKEEPFVEAAIALGLPRRRVIGRYILPNVAQSIPVIFSVNAADAVLTEAGLAVLGLGLPPGIPDWGFDISLNWQRFDASWWATFFPGLFILILTTALTFVGEGLNDILNPLLRRRETKVGAEA
ncbi:MAG: ABC transporter permease [Methanobacteriota archaeon]|nr:MAG: ABC transporter permease [Euryarchaeota archaeon]TMA06166.1 MAG: ABC transporter permease [Euryarchaeota archaeon]